MLDLPLQRRDLRRAPVLVPPLDHRLEVLGHEDELHELGVLDHLVRLVVEEVVVPLDVGDAATQRQGLLERLHLVLARRDDGGVEQADARELHERRVALVVRQRVRAHLQLPLLELEEHGQVEGVGLALALQPLLLRLCQVLLRLDVPEDGLVIIEAGLHDVELLYLLVGLRLQLDVSLPKLLHSLRHGLPDPLRQVLQVQRQGARPPRDAFLVLLLHGLGQERVQRPPRNGAGGQVGVKALGEEPVQLVVAIERLELLLEHGLDAALVAEPLLLDQPLLLHLGLVLVQGAYGAVVVPASILYLLNHLGQLHARVLLAHQALQQHCGLHLRAADLGIVVELGLGQLLQPLVEPLHNRLYLGPQLLGLRLQRPPRLLPLLLERLHLALELLDRLGLFVVPCLLRLV
mmetsp:Transcript_27355/g.72179  ORF Transcript_27355/g.72179 Transcript_27355/m.72179 type:complete len:405 (-) Transcript_27355:149-1363(-)